MPAEVSYYRTPQTCWKANFAADARNDGTPGSINLADATTYRIAGSGPSAFGGAMNMVRVASAQAIH
jgi:hypothetical protein